MKDYIIEYPRMHGVTKVSVESDTAAIQRAESLYPSGAPTGWLKSRRQGRVVYDRLTQFEVRDHMLEETGVFIDCFQTLPAGLEDFSLKTE